MCVLFFFFFFQAEDGIRVLIVTGVQTCALPILGAAPGADANAQVREDFVQRGARMASTASNTFNDGLRAYYFGLSVLPWFLNAWLFMVSTIVVIGILYHREFKSDALKAMLGRD